MSGQGKRRSLTGKRAAPPHPTDPIYRVRTLSRNELRLKGRVIMDTKREKNRATAQQSISVMMNGLSLNTHYSQVWAVLRISLACFGITMGCPHWKAWHSHIHPSIHPSSKSCSRFIARKRTDPIYRVRGAGRGLAWPSLLLMRLSGLKFASRVMHHHHSITPAQRLRLASHMIAHKGNYGHVSQLRSVYCSLVPCFPQVVPFFREVVP
ncbi:MAG TPA: hypothetical protein VN207_12995 [Ktedonobacteraceae bacterium]|nr:hypothetical protein [Ktedonobacteraceae bacterium]